MVVTINYKKNAGNAALYARARDSALRFWNWSVSAWDDAETAPCRLSLAENYDPANQYESNYTHAVEVVPPAGMTDMEFVLAAESRVLGVDLPPDRVPVPQASHIVGAVRRVLSFKPVK